MEFGDGSENRANEIALISDYRFRNDLLWKFNLKYMDAPRANYVDFGGSTISEVTANDGFTLSNGDPYEGLAEGRRTWVARRQSEKLPNHFRAKQDLWQP